MHEIFSRRSLLRRSGAGFGTVGMLSALAADQSLGNSQTNDGGLHHAARAKRVIFLFMNGAPSHVDTFDPKPMLAKHAGQTVRREAIHKQIIGREYDGLDRTVDVRVSHLRRKLGDNADTPFRIKTVWGKGYLFVADAWN